MTTGHADRLGAAVRIAREGGLQTLELFRRGVEVSRKADGSEVTEADRACERLMRKRIGEAFPCDGVIGEEYGETPGTSEYRWLLDPIDGTTSFVRGVPLYGTLVAVEREGRSVAGVIFMPALDEMVYAGAGGGAWHVDRGSEPRRARVSGVGALKDAMVATTSAEYFRRAGVLAAWEAVRSRAGQTRGWSDCYAFVLLATGRVDAVVEPVLHPWDIAPMQPIIEEAGGTCTDWNGKATIWEPRGLCTNGKIAGELVAALGGG